MAARSVSIPTGEDAYLSPEEIAAVQRIMRYPEVFPEEFWRAVLQKVALSGEPIPRSQVQGLTQFAVRVADEITTKQSTQSTTYTNLATTGPTLADLANGTYLFLYGANIENTGNNQSAYVGLSVNGSTPSDSNSIHNYLPTASNINVSRGQVVELAQENNNTITVKYRVDNGLTGMSWEKRWLVALRVN